MPSAAPEASRFGALTEALNRFCAERHLALVDLSVTLGRPARREYLLPADPVHPTAEGAKLVAKALLPRIVEALERR
jgi:lysophospholipase L1-like esterase